MHHLLLDFFGTFDFSGTVANVIAVALALFVVTFLHLVVGEMAPKSWAIAHPESALTLIAVPARVFVAIFRPLLTWINNSANRLVRATGEEPVDRADAKTLHQLVGHSVDTGTLDEDSARDIQGVTSLEFSTVGERGIVREPGTVTGVLTWDDVMNQLWPEIQRVTKR